MDQRKCRIHLMLCSTIACSTLSCSLTAKPCTPFSLFVGSDDLLWRSMQWADRPHPRHGSSCVSDDRPPIRDLASPVSMVCRPAWLVAIATYPTTISFPCSLWGAQHVWWSRSIVIRCSNAQSSTLNWPMFLQWRVEETVAWLIWTKLSPVN